MTWRRRWAFATTRSCWCCWTLASASRSSAGSPSTMLHDDYLKIHGKGRKEREVGFTPTTAKFLWKYINLHRAAESEAVRALFTNIRGRQMSPSGIEQIFDKIARSGRIGRGRGRDAAQTAAYLRADLAGAWRRALQPLAAHGPQQRQDHRDLPGGLQEPPGARYSTRSSRRSASCGSASGGWTPQLPARTKQQRREAAQGHVTETDTDE